MKLDILVLSAHPDDAELGCGGTIAKHVHLGHQVGIVDLTRGEMGTRGTPGQRKDEAHAAAQLLGISVRENLGLEDAFFQNDKANQVEVVKAIRKFQPEVVLANAITDRHPDHGRGAELAYNSCFLAGLSKMETSVEGIPQKVWRPRAVYHFIQSQPLTPDLVVDISNHWEQKINAIRAYQSQFFDPQSKEPETYISSPEFLKMLESRAIDLGHSIGVKYGEGFVCRRYPGVRSLFDLI